MFNSYLSQKGKDDPSLQIDLWGRRFPNPLGLAAGYDKNAETMDSMLAMGFGFVEVGSVCPRPQPGNPLPRVFRLKKEGAIINRFGFNTQGMESAEKRLRAFRARQEDLAAIRPLGEKNFIDGILEYLPIYYHRKQTRENALRHGIVGVNLGKNKDSIVPMQVVGEDGKPVLDDYSKVAQCLGSYADYLVVNVSSPNTPNLRDLQGAKELTAILTRLNKVRDNMPQHKPPILIKISPDVSHEQVIYFRVYIYPTNPSCSHRQPILRGLR